MAIFSCHVKVIGRASRTDARSLRAPRSVTAAAAYRAGTRIVDERSGLVHDYRRKRDVDYCVILAPDQVPAWMQDRAALWNAIEKIEKRKDAQLAREMMVALPRELSREQGILLVDNWVRAEFVTRGMVADVCFHKLSSPNPHAHILLTLREVSANGFGQKNRGWNDRALVEVWRSSWAAACNAALAAIGSTEKLDHRSYVRQELAIEPTIHLGPLVHAMERRGIRTELGSINRAIMERRSLWQVLAQESSRLLHKIQQALADLVILRRRRLQVSAVMNRAWQQVDEIPLNDISEPDDATHGPTPRQ